MELSFGAAEKEFRDQVAGWLAEHLDGEFSAIRFRGGPGDDHKFFDERRAWERRLGEGGWIGIAWPEDCGGRGLSLTEQVIFHEEYAAAGGPGRVGHMGETLLAPTLIAFGTPEQKARFLPGVRLGEELWCQGYSEPGAGSDLAAIRTRARFDEGEGQWRIDGQKVWTSLAAESEWCFVLARSEEGSRGREGLACLLVPMDQPGVEIRPIRQMTGSSEFNEVFFDDARADAAHVVGAAGEGWQVAMGTLAFERGVSTLGQQMNFQNEFKEVVRIATDNGMIDDAEIRRRLCDSWIRLRIMRFNALRTLSGADGGELGPEAMIAKLYWGTWHREFGKLALDVMGAGAEVLQEFPYEMTRLQSVALFARADTIYAGTNQIQRNIIAERALGLPREPKPPDA